MTMDSEALCPLKTMGSDSDALFQPKAPAAELSSERTARREDGTRMKTSEELQMRRSDSFMTPMPGGTEPPSGSPDGEEIPKCKLAFEEVSIAGVVHVAILT